MHRSKAVLLLAVLICPSSIFAAPATKYLFGRADFPTGNQPTGIAVGDFNGDGRQDVAVTNQGDDTVSVLLGQPNGTLGPKTDFPTGMSPAAVVVADFNHDGKSDIAVVDASGFVSILLGNGDGTFNPHVDYATGVAPVGLVVADFNRDGIADVAVVDSCGTTCGFVSILLGKGDGTFTPHVDYETGVAPSGLVVADFNGDGIADLAVADSCGSTCGFVSILLGKGDGTFQTHTDFSSSPGPWGIATGDFNGDKIPDLVLTHSDAPWALTIMKGNGDGTFQPEHQIATDLATSTVNSADVNGDGKLDLVLTVNSQGGPGVFLGNGDGTFQAEVTYVSGAYPLALAIQDINGDGTPDLLVTDWSSNSITALLGNGNGTFSPKTSLPPSPSSSVPLSSMAAVVGDFNGDGIPDLALAEGSSDYTNTGVVSVLLGKGKGAFQTSVNSNSNGALFAIAAADFNGDGRLDVALSNGNGAAVMLGNGAGGFGAPLQIVNTLATPARGLAVGDFNNDGHQDVIVVGNGFVQTQPIYVVLGNGDGTFQPAKQFWSSTSIPITIAAADFNHDGKLDIVVALNPNGIAVMLGNGDGTFQSPLTYPTDDLPSGLTVADVNGDGIADIIATGDQVDVFLGKGDGTFSSSVNYSGGNFPQQVITGDVNADGKLDLIVAAEGTAATGAIEILLGNGDGTFQSPVEIQSGGTGPMAVGDLNQDGTADIITTGYPGALFLSGPLATLSPFSINFGTVSVSSTSPAMNLTLVNSGNAPLDLSAITTTTDYSATNACGGSVAVSSSCTASVTFTPATSGSSSGVFTITDNSPQGRQNVPLSGTGQPGFSMTPASTTLTLQPGAMGTDVITLAGTGGSFGNAIQLTCAVTGPTPMPTCSFSSSSVAPGANSVTSTLTVSAPATVATLVPESHRGPSNWLYAVYLPAPFVIVVFAGSRKKLVRHSWFLAFFVVLILLQVACGGSGSGTGNTGPSSSYTVRVIGTSGAIQQTTQITVTVQ
jgi:hypothetical protein